MRKGTNRLAISRIGWIIRRMHDEAALRGAVVYRAEDATKGSPFRIFVFTMLSARTRDEATLKAVERLFKLADSPASVISLGRTKLEGMLYGVGFYRTKAKNLIEACRMMGGEGVPDSIEGLLALPGVGRKTANIVLARAFGKSALGVDVHVHRISNRLGIVRTKKPQETETALMKAVPSRFIRTLNRDFVAYGQTVCLPRGPRCGICKVRRLCWRAGVVQAGKRLVKS